MVRRRQSPQSPAFNQHAARLAITIGFVSDLAVDSSGKAQLAWVIRLVQVHRLPIFGDGMKQRSYRSEATLFIEQLKAQRPHLEEQQQKGRSIWWDKPQDLDSAEERASAKVPQKPYVYHNA